MLVNVENFNPVYPATDSFRNLHLSILYHAFHRGENWNFDHLMAPHWRLYWNPCPDAGVIFKDRYTALEPSRLYVIPADTPFSSRSHGPFSQFFVHFIMGGDYAQAKPGIYASDLSDSRRAMIDQIKERSKKGKLGDETGTLLVMKFILDAVCAIPRDAWETPAADPRIRSAVKMITEQGIKTDMDNRFLARQAGLSPNAFIRLFSLQMKIPPMKYLTRKRLDHAALLLRFSDDTIDDIAQKCRFCDRFHMSRLFKQRYSVGPARYRLKKMH